MINRNRKSYCGTNNLGIWNQEKEDDDKGKISRSKWEYMNE
jgi:hypothetical protein